MLLVPLDSLFILQRRAKPFDETADTFLNRRLRVIAKQSSRFRYVGEGLRHVAGLQGLSVNDGITPQLFFEQTDQFAKFHSARLAEVHYFVQARLVIQRRAHARDDVFNVCVIAARRAVAEDGDWLALRDEPRELMYGEVW